MEKIATFVFFDIETTGLPHQERNRTKIIELSLVATSRRDIENTRYGDTPPVSKLTYVFNPLKKVHHEVTLLTGLSNDLLKHAPLFNEKVNSLVSFLQELQQPVCLVAHNGNIFDFKLLKTEFQDAAFTGTSLPSNLLCADSLIGFRKLLKGTSISHKTLALNVQNEENLLTDDEDDWPDFNISTEEWQEIDEICLSISDMSYEDFDDEKDVGPEKITKTSQQKKSKKDKAIKKVFNSKPTYKESFTLSALYKRLLNKEEINAHRAEADCFMLLKCVVAVKEDFILWADSNCRYLTDIKPLERH